MSKPEAETTQDHLPDRKTFIGKMGAGKKLVIAPNTYQELNAYAVSRLDDEAIVLESLWFGDI